LFFSLSFFPLANTVHIRAHSLLSVCRLRTASVKISEISAARGLHRPALAGTRCSLLQCVAVCCSVWQCVAVWCCSVLQSISAAGGSSWLCWPIFVAVCCSLLQSVAVCCGQLRSCCSQFWLFLVHETRICLGEALVCMFSSKVCVAGCVAVCCSLFWCISGARDPNMSTRGSNV